jgi:transcriptional antiterminator RfaH
MLGSGLSVLSESSVSIGSRVKILTGPLEGIEGTVVRRGNRDQFVAVVNFLRQGAVVDLQDWQVERI